MEIEYNVAFNEGYYLYKARMSCLNRKYTIRIAAESFEKALKMANEYANGDLIVSIINTNKNIIIQRGVSEIK
jgi:hypothetical protein